MTVKQMNVIYRAYKHGKLGETSKDDIDVAYMLVKKANSEVRAYELKTYQPAAYKAVQDLKNAVDAIFAENYEEAARWVCGINCFANAL